MLPVEFCWVVRYLCCRLQLVSLAGYPLSTTKNVDSGISTDISAGALIITRPITADLLARQRGVSHQSHVTSNGAGPSRCPWNPHSTFSFGWGEEYRTKEFARRLAPPLGTGDRLRAVTPSILHTIAPLPARLRVSARSGALANTVLWTNFPQ